MLTREDVNEAIRKHLQSKSLVVALITEDPELALQTLRSGKPTPIHYDGSGTPRRILEEDQIIERLPVNLSIGGSRIVTPDELFER